MISTRIHKPSGQKARVFAQSQEFPRGYRTFRVKPRSTPGARDQLGDSPIFRQFPAGCRVYGDTRPARVDPCLYLSPSKRVAPQVRRIQDTRGHGLGQSRRFRQRIGDVRSRRPADRIERDLCFGDQFLFPLLYDRICRHVWLPVEGVLDGPARQLAGPNHVFSSGRMMRLGVIDHVHNVRLQCHLQIDAGCQVRASRIGVQGIAQRSRACLVLDAKVRAFQRTDHLQAGQHLGQVHSTGMLGSPYQAINR